MTKSADIWRYRLDHHGAGVSETLRKASFVQFKSVFSKICTSCTLAKSHRLLFLLAEHRTNSPLQLIHSDVWQSRVLSRHGFKYYVSFIDDYSYFTWLYPMECKSEVYDIFTKF